MPEITIAYEHNQAVAGTLWTVDHGLGRRPVVQTIDAAGIVVEGEVVHVSSNQLTVEFSVAIAGKATCS